MSPTVFNGGKIDVSPRRIDPICDILTTRFVVSRLNQPSVERCCDNVFKRFVNSNVHLLTLAGISARNEIHFGITGLESLIDRSCHV
jgi:hypothetical protein